MLLNTVDGRNPAPVDIMVNIPLFTGFYTSQVVVSDFFHQQYYYYFTFLGNAVHCATHSNPCKINKKDLYIHPPPHPVTGTTRIITFLGSGIPS